MALAKPRGPLWTVSTLNSCADRNSAIRLHNDTSSSIRRIDRGCSFAYALVYFRRRPKCNHCDVVPTQVHVDTRKTVSWERALNETLQTSFSIVAMTPALLVARIALPEVHAWAARNITNPSSHAENPKPQKQRQCCS